MPKIIQIPQRERRKNSQRVLWISPPEFGLERNCFCDYEKRTDLDGSQVAIELARQLANGQALGIVFGVLKSTGRFELGATGALYDNPLVADGVASKLHALLDSWRDHPSLFLPVSDDS